MTEWLPVSSSGHLVIAQSYMGLRLPVFFDVLLHLGSLFVVLIVFRDDVLKILKALLALDFKSEAGKHALFIVLGSIPTAVVGLAFKDFFESLFSNVLAVGVAFIITGSFLFVSERRKGRAKPLNYLDAVIMGIAQGVAIIPGISRNGATITTGLLRKVDKQAAFRFSFLLFIPAVVGAAVSTAVEESATLPLLGVDYVGAFLALVTTVVLGYVSLKLLQRTVLRGSFHLFAYYCWALGIIVVLSQVLA